MRYVFYFVALLSAFFSYAYEEYVRADVDSSVLYEATTSGVTGTEIDGSVIAAATLIAERIPQYQQGDCELYVTNNDNPSRIVVKMDCQMPNPNGTTYPYSKNIFVKTLEPTIAYKCPPGQSETHTIGPVNKPGEPTDTEPSWCLDPNYSQNPDSCPSVSGDSLSTINFTSPDVNSVCFDNPNGEGECSYEVTNGMYNLPPELSTAEPVECGSNEPITDDTPPLDPEENCYETTNGAYCNEDPDEKCSVVTDPLTGDSYTQCQENCGYINGDFFCLDDGTDTPDEPPVPSECQDPAYRAANPNKCKSNQDTDKDGDGQVDNTDIVEALNQLSSQGDDRANTLNNLLGEAIEGNSLSKEGNKLLKKISDKLDKDDEQSAPPSATAQTKTGGLYDFFTDSDIEQVKQQVDAAKSEITDYLSLIKNEASQYITITPPSSGGYETRTVNLYNQEHDYSLSRFRELFQSFAPILLLIATITALYIILDGKS